MELDDSPARPITEAEVERFWSDGVVHLPQVLEPTTVASLEPAIARLLGDDSAMADMTAMAEAFGREPSAGTGGRFISGVDHWIADPDFEAFATRSPLPAIAATILRSEKINLYEDSVLIKQPGAAEATALHQDLAYFHVEGEQICTMWMPLDRVDRSSGAVHYVAGSHLDGTLFRPNFFVSTEPIPGTEGAEVPDVDDDALVWFDTEPGDVVIHHARTLHGASANLHLERSRRALSVRYCGDDVRYRMRPGAPRKPHHDESLDGTPLDHPACPVVWPPPYDPIRSLRRPPGEPAAE